AGRERGLPFVSEEAACRAGHLLQYIGDGWEKSPEYKLRLNKILCGLTKAQPVEKALVLTDEEKNTRNQLIRAAMHICAALGEASSEAFRESFLQRGGQLIFFDSKMELRVERKAFDQLLKKLPWSLSPVKLPWMNKPLYVEWKN